ncbi:MAG: hypothetical protein D6820_16940, partial [Lentisphaerae bacterium]
MILSWGILWVAFLFSLATDSVVVFFLTGMICVCAIIPGRSLRLHPRSQIYLSSLALILAAIISLSTPFNIKNFFVDISFLVPFLLLASALFLFLDQRPWSFGLILGCIMLALGLCGTSFGLPQLQVWPKFQPPFNELRTFYLLALANCAFVLLTVPLKNMQRQTDRRFFDWKQQLRRSFINVGATLSVFLFAFLAWRSFPWLISRISLYGRTRYRQYVESRALRLRGFQRQTQISYPSWLKNDMAANHPVMYLKGSVPGGCYLRGRSYWRYYPGKGIWEASD